MDNYQKCLSSMAASLNDVEVSQQTQDVESMLF